MNGVDWDVLTLELDAWADAKRVLPLWWRDDDAAEPLPALATLLDLADAFQVEVGLAVVPALASDALATGLTQRSNVAVLQHGYSHRNHAPEGARAIECGGARPVDEVLDELRRGRLRLADLFDDRFRPILAAPWNRIDVAVRCASANAALPACRPSARARSRRVRRALRSPMRMSIR